MKKLLLITAAYLAVAYASAQSGNVGINTPAPASKLEIKGDGSVNILNVVDQNDNSKLIVSPAGNVGIGINVPLTKFHIIGTDAVVVPVGTTLQRPANPPSGATRLNSDTKILEYFDGTQWRSTNTQQVPIGTIIPFAGAAVPSGWLLCDGSTISRTTYSDLFAAVGTAWGNGDGSTTFNLPDLRGRFIRGVDGGTGRDPDAAGRVASNSGGNTGSAVGSLQYHAIPTHTLGVTGTISPESGHTHTWGGWWSNDNSTDPANGNGDGNSSIYSDGVGYWSNSVNQGILSGSNNVGHTHTWGGWWSNDNALSAAWPEGDGSGNTYSDGWYGHWGTTAGQGVLSPNHTHSASHNITVPYDNDADGGYDNDGLSYESTSGTKNGNNPTEGGVSIGNAQVWIPPHRHFIKQRSTSGESASHQHQVPNHRHWIKQRTTSTGSSHTHAFSLNANTISGTNVSTETRPQNVNVQYIIKAENNVTSAITAVNISAGSLGQTLTNDGSNWIPSNFMFNTGASIGVGTTLPTAVLDVNGTVRLRNLTSGVVKSDANGNLSASLVGNADMDNVITAGVYKSVAVNAQGRVTAGTNPTTLAGYGITDAAPVSGSGSYIQNQYASAQTANQWISGETRTGSWFRNSAAGTGLYNESTAAGIYSPSAGIMSTYGGANFRIEANTLIGNSGSSGTYGGLTIQGAKNGWGGLNFKNSGGTTLGTFMINEDISGVFNNTDNGWDWYFQNGTLTTGTIPLSLVNVNAGGAYMHLGAWGGPWQTGNGVLVQGAYYNWGGVPSDRKLKTDISLVKGAELKDLSEKLLNSPLYYYKYLNAPVGNTNDLHIGFMADEVPEVMQLPDKTGIKIGDTMALLLAALKVMQQENDELKNRVTQLESQILR